MSDRLEMTLHKLLSKISRHVSVRAIGLSGGESPLPEPGEGDIDVFLYCTKIPEPQERKEILLSLAGEIEAIDIGKLEGGHWGQGDRFLMAGVETWLLYFTVAETHAELESILNGNCPGRFDSYYYPIGRCAMWKRMHVCYDPDDFLASLKRRLHEYPEQLALLSIDFHMRSLGDVEDLERAVQRKDVFFYHFALDLALDHMLQAIFAINREYFPSRKRTEAYLRGFSLKPPDCEARLRQVIALGGKAETLEQSYEIWKGLLQDIDVLGLAARDGQASIIK